MNPPFYDFNTEKTFHPDIMPDCFLFIQSPREEPAGNQMIIDFLPEYRTRLKLQE
jgi:hypothetical protein